MSEKEKEILERRRRKLQEKQDRAVDKNSRYAIKLAQEQALVESQIDIIVRRQEAEKSKE